MSTPGFKEHHWINRLMQMLAWRDAAVRLSKEVRGWRALARMHSKSLEAVRGNNRKLLESLNSVVAERNRIDFVRSHHVATISATMATRDEFFRNWKEAERKLHAWRNDAAVRGLTSATVFAIERDRA